MALKFDPQVALEHAKAIARPRLVGTADEQVVADELACRLQGVGYQVAKEPFQFWNAVGIAIILLVLTSMLIVGLALTGVVPYYVSAASLLVLLLTFRSCCNVAESLALLPDANQVGGAVRRLLGSLLSRLVDRLGMVIASHNVVATLPGDPGTAPKKHLYLVAHYDTKSQPLSIPVRIVLFVVLFVGGIGFVVSAPLASAYNGCIPVAFAFGLAVIAAGAPLVLNGYANRSPGAIDNASGIGAVLHLAELMIQSPELRLRLDWTILFTSAEEMCLMGAAAYVKRHRSELGGQSGAVYVINFDGVGVDGRLFYDARGKVEPGELVRLTREAAKARGIEVRPLRLVGTLLDHIPFARRGVDALSLLTIGQASRTVHTNRDTVNLLHLSGFAQAGNVAVEVIERL